MNERANIYVNGVLRPASGGVEFDDVDPWTGQVFARAADASSEDMDEAIAAARMAFDEGTWAHDPALRRDYVVKLSGRLKDYREELVRLARHEAGAAMGFILGPQVDRPLRACETLLKLFDSLTWETDMGTMENRGVMHQRYLVQEPVGVVGAITPWNNPFSIAIGKVIPALLAGCTLILKPAPETPLISCILGLAAHDVGLPKGVLNIVTSGHPTRLGEMLVSDKRVDLITFTGSTAAGRRIMELGAPTLKRVFLELGGKSAHIVFADTPDFEATVASAMVTGHAGQGCAFYSRLLVQRSRYEEAIAILKKAYDQYASRWGCPVDPTNVMGPVISARQRDRVMTYIEAGKAEGARLIAGGSLATDKGTGFFIEPTCFVDVTNDMKIAREEIFGPVLVVIPFEDERDAIRIANDSEYGLSGGVSSGDRVRSMSVARRIRSGMVGVNGGSWSSTDMPFGGCKQSGFGREWGLKGFEEFLQVKAVGVRM